MEIEHVPSLGIDKRVDLQGGRAVLEDREHRRGQKNVAVVAQLDHQRAPQAGNVDRVGRAVLHPAQDSRKSSSDACRSRTQNRYSALARSVRPGWGYALNEVPALLRMA